MGDPAEHRLTYAEYLDLETATGLRHEFLDGEVRAMSGGTPRHSADLVAWLRHALRGAPCRPYDSDLRIRVPSSGLATYADASVISGGIQPHPDDRDAATNPVALFEVLSPTTESWDRGGKWDQYRELASLRHYVLVRQDDELVLHYARQPDGSWRFTEHRVGDTVDLAAIDRRLPVDELYADAPA